MNAIPLRLTSLLAALALGAASARARAEDAPLAPAEAASAPLRVCADPNSLPYSNRAERGFENEIAALLGRALERRVEYFWWAQRRGFLRNTLSAGRCDVVMSVPAGAARVLTTEPYYRSSYVFVQRPGSEPIHSLDDAALRTLKVGVQLIGDDFANSPPAHSLGRRGIVDNVVGFMVYGDYSSSDPERPIIDAVASGKVDVAIVWGPLGGYYAQQSKPPLSVSAVVPATDGDLRLSFAMSLAVRKKDVALRDLLDQTLQAKRREVDEILARYGVPRVEGVP
jgi:quinoprotein dehydrogenase-associated probable ABC transporter substrate-binding protein